MFLFGGRPIFNVISKSIERRINTQKNKASRTREIGIARSDQICTKREREDPTGPRRGLYLSPRKTPRTRRVGKKYVALFSFFFIFAFFPRSRPPESFFFAEHFF